MQIAVSNIVRLRQARRCEGKATIRTDARDSTYESRGIDHLCIFRSILHCRRRGLLQSIHMHHLTSSPCTNIVRSAAERHPRIIPHCFVESPDCKSNTHFFDPIGWVHKYHGTWKMWMFNTFGSKRSSNFVKANSRIAATMVMRHAVFSRKEKVSCDRFSL